MQVDKWIEFLNTVGATFWRGFPYDIAALLALGLVSKWTENKVMLWLVISLGAIIVINLAVATIPAWFKGITY